MKKMLLLTIFMINALFASGSREGDSLALVAIQEANHTYFWPDITKPLDEWDLISLKDGRVDSIGFYHDPLRILPPEIENLNCLRVLKIERGYLLYPLPVEIGNLSNLEEIYFIDMKLKNIPLEIGNLSNLKILNLIENELTSLPSEICNLSNLITLDLDRNQLTTIPPEIGNLKNLVSLGLFYNSLSTLPPEIGDLANLEALYLSGNIFTSLPAEIGNLSNLKTLRLNNNSLTSLPAEIGNLLNLKTLSLNNNSLTSLPAEIGNISNLINLELESNSLVALPPEIGNITALGHLNLKNNSITNLPEEITELHPRLFVEYNNLSASMLSSAVIEWIDIQYDGMYDWRETQGEDVAITEKTKSSVKQFSVKMGTNNLHFSTPLDRGSQLSIYTVNGRELVNKQVSGLNAAVPALAKGIYFARINSQSINRMFKISVR